MQSTIIDDQTPFLRAGVPAVDPIDWSYPGHSRADKLSMRSVDAVGETIVEFVRELDRADTSRAASGADGHGR